MSRLEKDSFEKYFDEESIIAPNRMQRPFIHPKDTNCPFCLNHQDQLGQTILESWLNEEPLVRIVANKYPVVDSKRGEGYHDVIIDTPHHLQHPKDFTTAHWQMLLTLMQQRWQMLAALPEVNFIQIFKNSGTLAGASISHSHWQMIALHTLPRKMKEKYQSYYYGQDKEKCYLCQLSHDTEGICIVESTHWRVWVPPTPQFSYEVWLIPKKHVTHYGQLEADYLRELGILLKKLLKAYDEIRPDCAFNICFMSGELDGKRYHFYIKLVMRISYMAGFEIATGCYILSVSPKDYALALKKRLEGI